LLKHLQSFEFVAGPQVRHTEVVDGLGFSGAVACGSQEHQRLQVIVDRGSLVAEVVIYLTDAVEDPAEQLAVLCR